MQLYQKVAVTLFSLSLSLSSFAITLSFTKASSNINACNLSSEFLQGMKMQMNMSKVVSPDVGLPTLGKTVNFKFLDGNKTNFSYMGLSDRCGFFLNSQPMSFKYVRHITIKSTLKWLSVVSTSQNCKGKYKVIMQIRQVKNPSKACLIYLSN